MKSSLNTYISLISFTDTHNNYNNISCFQLKLTGDHYIYMMSHHRLMMMRPNYLFYSTSF